jgi:hypothetical protein
MVRYKMLLNIAMKTKVSSLNVLKDIFSGILPDEIIYEVSKFHGRWIRLNVQKPIRLKVKQPRNRHTHKKHLISHYYM